MMDWATALIILVVGVILGFAGAFLLKLVHLTTARELIRESGEGREESITAIIDTVMKIGREKLESERELTAKELESKKSLIDQQLKTMTAELERMATLVNTLEKDREQKFGELASQLENAGRQTQELIKTTGSLREALVSSKARGQWGERMAEDILRVAGFIENVNYVKQRTIEGVGNKPDFTFMLPRDLRLNMDVKFPYDNYIRFLEAEHDSDRDAFRRQFLKDVRTKIKDIATRDYINPEQNTVDYVLMFIPNEQIYAFINEQDTSILDESIKNKVIICSPITLFAVLAVVRQAVDNFTFEQKSHEMLTLLGKFNVQWQKFTTALRKVGDKIRDANTEYDILISTRKNQLERPLKKIEEIRQQRGLFIADTESPDDDDQ
ncbi:DNA recombination protein RmuC [Candidatus Latescibacterota bacterium]